MTNLNYRLAFITDHARLAALCHQLAAASVFALDLETIGWWNPARERIALVQIAYRPADQQSGGQMRVAVIDALTGLELSALLRPVLESSSVVKVMHNAAFDATRLARHYQITAAPIYDTLLAARRGGESHRSLKAQVARHLNLPLDKAAQTSDWSVRPLATRQLDYAARDAAATLLLYEHQRGRGLRGDYQLRLPQTHEQVGLPLGDVPSIGDVSLRHVPDVDDSLQHASSRDALARDVMARDTSPDGARPAADDSSVITTPVSKQGSSSSPSSQSPPAPDSSASPQLPAASLALLGIITELASRYSPQQLAVSVGAEQRVGLAGWIVDRMLGTETDIDESSAQMMIAELYQAGLISITPARRLVATDEGRAVWLQHKNI